MVLLTQLFLVSIISLLILYTIGYFIIKLINLPSYERNFLSFLSFFVGLIFSVSIYAVICTKGGTVQTFMIILLLAILFLMHNKPGYSQYTLNIHKKTHNNYYKSLAPILLCIPVFAVQYLLLYDLSSDYLQTPFQDYVYYSRLTLVLNQLGIETNSLESIFPQFVTEQPYHYLELWLNALVVRITNLPSVWIYFISSSSIMITIICVGFMAIFSHFRINYKWVPFFAFLFLFISGMRWSFLQQFTFVSNGALLSSLLVCLNPKLTPIYILLLLCALLLLNKHYIAAGVALAMVPVAFISTTPVLGMALGVIVLYLYLKNELLLKQSFYMILPMILVGIAIALFYLLQPEPYQFPDTGRSYALRSIIPQINEIKTIINILIGVFINYGIYFIAYAVVLFIALYLNRQNIEHVRVPQVVWVWFGSSLIFAAALRAFGTHYLDSFQFFSNTMVPLTPVVLAIIVAAILQKSPSYVYTITFALLSVLVVINFLSVGTGNTRYSPAFLKNVEELSPKIGSRGCYILADEEYENAYMLSSDSYTTGNYISNFKNDYAFISLSALDADSLTTDSRFQRDSAQAEQIIRKSTFYKFAKFQALKNRRMPLDSIKYEFVDKNNIGFICVSKKANLPSVLYSFVQKKYVDSLSGEKLYILHRNSKK